MAQSLAEAKIVDIFLAISFSVSEIVGEFFEPSLVLAGSGKLNANRIACRDSAEDAFRAEGDLGSVSRTVAPLMKTKSRRVVIELVNG